MKFAVSPIVFPADEIRVIHPIACAKKNLVTIETEPFRLEEGT
jgi:hypothetical protein